MSRRTTNNSERGVATVEFAIAATVFFMMLVVVVIGGHIYWTNNALVEATRRGARFAANQLALTAENCLSNSNTPNIAVKNMVLYGTSTAGTTPIVPGLQASNVTVCYSTGGGAFGVATGTVSVKIENYTYNLRLPGISRTITFPPYRSTTVGENAGFIPPDK